MALARGSHPCMVTYYIDREAFGNALLHAPLVAAILLSVTIIIGGREALMPGAALRLTSVAACYGDHRLQTIPLAGLRLTATALCFRGGDGRGAVAAAAWRPSMAGLDRLRLRLLLACWDAQRRAAPPRGPAQHVRAAGGGGLAAGPGAACRLGVPASLPPPARALPARRGGRGRARGGRSAAAQRAQWDDPLGAVGEAGAAGAAGEATAAVHLRVPDGRAGAARDACGCVPLARWRGPACAAGGAGDGGRTILRKQSGGESGGQEAAVDSSGGHERHRIWCVPLCCSTHAGRAWC